MTNPNLRAAIAGGLAGAASGILSQMGPAAILATTSPERLPRVLRSPWVRRLAIASAGGEVAVNAFIPWLPPRTTPGPLSGRVTFGAAGGALLARANGRPVAPAAIAGGLAAGVSAYTATRTRARLARHVPDLLVATAETVTAIVLARRATRT